jgi:RND family efflux transporter MFP subunit
MVKFLLKKPLSRIFIPALALFMLGFAVVTVANNPSKSSHVPAITPTKAEFESRIAGVGIIEPKSELISIGTNISGVVTKVFVGVNDKVKKGDKLFAIDNRDAKASLAKAHAELEVYRTEHQKLLDQYFRYADIKDKQAISEEELNRRLFALKSAEAKINQSIAKINSYKTTLKRLVVKAPIDAEILDVNIRAGEFATAGYLQTPLMVIGDTSTYHVRVEIEQTDALKVDANAMAKGILRGYSDRKTELFFVRKEPLITAKNNLTGDSRERVDTRIQQVIYAFDNSSLKSQIGQQMDIYIEDNNNQ